MSTNLVLRGNYGCAFFCDCIDVLQEIINFFNSELKPPDYLDASDTFPNFKDSKEDDVYKILFESCDDHVPFIRHINLHYGFAFGPYQYVDFDACNPLVKKYFSPSLRVKKMMDFFMEKYNINFDNTIYIIYRGNDKIKETKIASYEEFIEKSSQILTNNPNAIFFLQTDEIEFREKFLEKFKNTFFIEEIPAINKNPEGIVNKIIPVGERVEFGSKILSSLILGSRCKHIITYTGNMGLWSSLYRTNSNSVSQYVNGFWVDS